jgi:hypothetical protein
MDSVHVAIHSCFIWCFVLLEWRRCASEPVYELQDLSSGIWQTQGPFHIVRVGALDIAKGTAPELTNFENDVASVTRLW